MNKVRRNKINQLIEKLTENKKELENITSEEEESFDNMTEGLQATMRGMNMEDAIDNLNTAIECIEEAIDYMREASL